MTANKLTPGMCAALGGLLRTVLSACCTPIAVSAITMLSRRILLRLDDDGLIELLTSVLGALSLRTSSTLALHALAIALQDIRSCGISESCPGFMFTLCLTLTVI